MEDELKGRENRVEGVKPIWPLFLVNCSIFGWNEVEVKHRQWADKWDKHISKVESVRFKEILRIEGMRKDEDDLIFSLGNLSWWWCSSPRYEIQHFIYCTEIHNFIMKCVHIIHNYGLYILRNICKDKISLFLLQNLRTVLKWICYII